MKRFRIEKNGKHLGTYDAKNQLQAMLHLIQDVWANTVDDEGESLRAFGYATAEAAKLRPEFLTACLERLIANFDLSVVQVELREAKPPPTTNNHHLPSNNHKLPASSPSQNSYKLFWTDCDRGVDVDCSRTFDSVVEAQEGIGAFLEELLAMAQDEATCAVVLCGAVRCERGGSIEFVEGDLGSILDGRD